MKISKLKIKNFKAFYGDYEFDFCDDRGNAKNILIYGENGSGKSSLYWALYHIFNSYDKFHNVKKYKNIFAKEDSLKIEATFDNGNYVVFNEKDNKIIINETIKKNFEKLQKVKLFLSYNDIFLLNELFNRNITLENFIKILENIYGENIKKEIEEYKTAKKEFKKNYINQKCEIEKMFLEFIENFDNGNLLDMFMDELYEYEDIPKIDKEDNKEIEGIFETIYYFSDEVISSLQEFLDKLKFLNEELEFNSIVVDEVIEELNDIFEHMQEKSKEIYDEKMKNEEIFVTDIEEIETLNILDLIKTRLNFVDDIIDSYENYKIAVDSLNTAINSKLEKQTRDINKFLEENFKLNLNIKLAKKSDYFFNELAKLDDFQAIKYNLDISENSPKYNHLKFLNEAKISSINFAFYLSIILSYAELDELKILVLDDLLISLDMSNRDTVLDILLKYFPNYQIIILTHDRAFFEMAKQKFNYKSQNKWKYFEMYADKNCDTDMEFPFIKEYGTKYSHINKAKEHFDNKDYPACANYLRKEVEKQFDKYLEVSNLDKKIKLAKLKENYNIILKIEKDLKQLVKILKQFQYCEKMPQTIQAQKCKEFSEQVVKTIEKMEEYIKKFNSLIEYDNIHVYLKNILHPQSHNDITKPLYKKELEKVIKIIEELKIIIEGKTK